jgi:5-(carboxyamino)imidazole ribonucleotide synthase
MMAQAASVWHLKPVFLDPDPAAPVIPFAPCIQGDFRDYDTVLAFGRDKDLISYEIEQVNLDALRELERQGKRVCPSTRVLGLIRDKSVQKQFFAQLGLPSPEWIPYPASGAEAESFLPAFW